MATALTVSTAIDIDPLWSWAARDEEAGAFKKAYADIQNKKTSHMNRALIEPLGKLRKEIGDAAYVEALQKLSNLDDTLTAISSMQQDLLDVHKIKLGRTTPAAGA
eukprot:4590257-Pyramimonas_sp.AAC.1